MQESEFTGCANKVQGTPPNRKLSRPPRARFVLGFPQERRAFAGHIVQLAKVSLK